MNIKVRGIYTTALSQLLIKNGFKISEPSDLISERLELSNNKNNANLLIYDTENKNGICISGTGGEKVASMIRGNFLDYVIQKRETGRIYAGTVKNIGGVSSTIDLGEEEGILPKTFGLTLNLKVLVQVKGEGEEKLLLSKHLRIFGESMVLIKGGFTKVSKHIRNEKEKWRLLNISKENCPDGWGILWKSLAIGKADGELISEINELKEEEKRIVNEFEKTNKPKMLKEGMQSYKILFGLLSKRKLDEIRKEVAKTIKDHHLLKSARYSQIVELSEALLDSVKGEKILSGIKSIVGFPKLEGNYYLKHQKIDEEIIIKGRVIETNNLIRIKRKVKSFGDYNGLQIYRERGDEIITTIKPEEWYITHEYFSKEGKLKGKYININTPVEIFPNYASYIDLEIDIVEFPDGTKKLIDVKKFKSLIDNKQISKELVEKVKNVVNQFGVEYE